MTIFPAIYDQQLGEAIGFAQGTRSKNVNIVHSLFLLQQLRKTGFPAAFVMQGLIHYLGLGVPVDTETGSKLLKVAINKYKFDANKAKDAGPYSQYAFGRLLLEGIVFEKNQALARELLQAAADAGVVFALNSLGLLHLRGEGVPKNSQQATHHFRQASEQGDVFATSNMGFMTLRESEDQGSQRLDDAAGPNRYSVPVRRSLKTIRGNEYYRMAADKGHGAGLVGLGVSFHCEESEGGNLMLAAEYYCRAMLCGNSCAFYNIALLFFHTQWQGTLSGNHFKNAHPKEYPEIAFKLFDKASKLGDIASLYFLALMYRQGQGTTRNSELARKCMTQAAERGDSFAKLELSQGGWD